MATYSNALHGMMTRSGNQPDCSGSVNVGAGNANGFSWSGRVGNKGIGRIKVYVNNALVGTVTRPLSESFIVTPTLTARTGIEEIDAERMEFTVVNGDTIRYEVIIAGKLDGAFSTVAGFLTGNGGFEHTAEYTYPEGGLCGG